MENTFKNFRLLFLLVAFVACSVLLHAQPVITNVSPIMGTPGSSVTITGTGFNATAANNIVYFGATRASVTTASTTSLTAVVPIGGTHERVTVTNIANGLTGYSQYSFLPTYDNSPYLPDIIHFADTVNFATNPSAGALTISDIDGDGKPDLVVSGAITTTVVATVIVTHYASVFRNTSSSGVVSFASKVDFAISNGCSSILVKDIDGDGKPDLVCSNTISGFSVLRNTSVSGIISFAPNVNISGLFFAEKVAVGDIDGDGKADVACTQFNNPIVSVLRNTSSSGAISFAPKVNFAAGITPLGIEMGDIDGDGKADLVVTNYGPLGAPAGVGPYNTPGTFSVFRNTSSSGTISFAPRLDYATDTVAAGLTLGDIDGDGKPDVILANAGSNKISIFRNTSTSGSISFAAKILFNTGLFPVSVAIGDVNGDNKPDLAVVNAWSNTASVFRNTSSSGVVSFASKVDFASGNFPNNIVVGDIDGDSIADLAVTCASSSSNILSVLRNDPLFAITGTTAVCLGGTATLSNGSSGGTWSSGNPLVASIVSSTGIVTGINIGTASITYTFPGGSNMTSVVIMVSVPPNAGIITGPATVIIGQTITLANGAVGGVWNSGTPSVATIGTTGIVTGVSLGTCVISYGVSGTCMTAYSTMTINASYAPPVITNVSPYSGIPGTTVTITGTGFNAIAANNIVYFGATRATVTTASTTSLTVVVPIGATFKPITVTNSPNALTAYSQYPFLPSYDNSPYVPEIIHFSDDTVDLMPGTALSSTKTGDIDGDGMADLVCIKSVSLPPYMFSIFRNTSSIGHISFEPNITLTIGPHSIFFDLGDMNGDGKPDIVVPNHTAHMFSVFINTSTSGTISFAPRVDFFCTPYNVAGICVDDVDGDGRPDICFANWAPFGNDSISVIRNTSNSGVLSFAPRKSFAVDAEPSFLAMDDLDSDGKRDLVVSHGDATNSISVLRNTSVIGEISFDPFSGYVTGSRPAMISLADMDADGKLDINTSQHLADVVSTLRNITDTGGISFVPAITAGTGSFPAWVDAGDINGDEKPDLAITNYLSNSVSVFRNTSASGAISYAPKTDFTTNIKPRTVSVSDIDGDDLPDLVVTNNIATYLGSITILRNDPYYKISGATSVCLGSTSALSNATIGGTWSSGNTSVATVGSSTGIVTSIALGTATISYTFPGGSNITSVVVTIVTTPVVGAMSGTGFVCVGTTTNLSNTMSGGTWSSSTPTVATVGTNGLVTGIAAGSSTISYTVSNACGSVYATTVVTVSAATIPGVITGAASVCTGNITTLGNSISGGVWSSSDLTVATVNASGLVTGVTAGTCVISYVVTTGSCVNYATKTITVTTGIGPNTGTATMCIGGTTLLSNSTAGGTWSSSAPAKATVNPGTGLVTGISIGTSTISYTMSNGCYSLTQVSVNLLLTGNIAGSDLCIGAPGAFTHPVPGGVWTSSNLAVATIDAATGVVTGVGVGVTTITYTVGSCYRTRTVVVNSLGSLGTGIITGSSNVCLGSTTVITGPETGLAWTSSDPSVATIGITSGMVTGVTVGTVIMTFFYTHGCMYLTKPMTVMPLPTPITGIMAICQDYTTTLSSMGTTGGTWASSDLSSIAIDVASGVAIGLAGGSSTITYTWTNTCQQMAEVTVNPMPVPVAIVGTGIVSVGASTVLMPSAPGGTWACSNPSIATLMPSGGSACIMTGVSAGVVTITYTNTNGCGTTTVTRIFNIVGPKPGIQSTSGHTLFSIYPNPSYGKLEIEAPTSGTFTIYAIDGRFILQYSLTELSTTITLPNTLAPGIYMCRFNGDDGSTVMARLVYEH